RVENPPSSNFPPSPSTRSFLSPKPAWSPFSPGVIKPPYPHLSYFPPQRAVSSPPRLRGHLFLPVLYNLSPPLLPSPSTRSFLSPKPVWSAFRQAAYGFGVLSVGGGASKGEAVWRWRRNSDAAGVVADEASIISHASSKAPAQCRV
ncbi:unnamed protein product, partial [Closterium sp. NIES-65]